jgi:large subunit ribosomal protein L1
MPNPKTGTVGENIAELVKEIAGGKVNFKNDDSGNIHQIIGKSDFETSKLLENLKAFYSALMASKPAAFKGQFIASITLNSTMGPGVKIKI